MAPKVGDACKLDDGTEGMNYVDYSSFTGMSCKAPLPAPLSKLGFERDPSRDQGGLQFWKNKDENGDHVLVKYGPDGKTVIWRKIVKAAGNAAPAPGEKKDPPEKLNPAEYTDYAGEGNIGGVWTFYHKKPGSDDYIKQPPGGAVKKINKAEYDGVKPSLTFKKEKIDPKAGLGGVEKSLPSTGAVIPFAPLATTTPEEINKRAELEKALKAKGLDKDEIKAFMARFDEEPNAKKRMGLLNSNIEWTKDEKLSGDDIRKKIVERARDKEVEKCKAAMNPLETYNHLVAKGIVVDKIGDRHFLEGKDWKDVNPKSWEPVAAKGGALKKIAQDPMAAKADFKADPDLVRKETKRRVMVKEAHDRFIAYYTDEKNVKPPLSKEEAEKRFHKISMNLGMTNADGSVHDDWDPDAPAAKDKKDAVWPARAFFPEEDIFEKDGTIKKDAKFNPGKVKDEKLDPNVKVEEMDDVTRAYYLPSTEERVADFKKQLVEKEGYTPQQADFIAKNLDPKGRPLGDCSTEEVRGLTQTFLSHPKAVRDQGVIMISQNKLAKDYAEKMGVSETAARVYLANKGVLRRSATMEQVDFEQKRVAAMKAPPKNMSLDQIRKDPQYKDWLDEREALFSQTGADRDHKNGNEQKIKELRARLDPADLQYQDQLSMMDEQTKKQLMLKQVDQKNMLELEGVKQENLLKQIKARHENDKELEGLRNKNQMGIEQFRQGNENLRFFSKLVVDFLQALLNIYAQSVNADKQMLGTITAAHIRAGGVTR